jgi:hypothetical protein
VQLLADTGLAGFLIVGGGWLLFYGRLIRLWRRRRDPWARGLGLGGLAALAAGAFHALGEFPFRIPGFSLTYAAIAALTFLTLHYHQDRDGFGYAAWRLAGNRLAPWVCSGLILFQAVYLSQTWNFWQAERAAPLGLDSTRLPRTIAAADYTRALELNPRNAGLYAGLAGVLASEEIANREQAQKIEDLLHQAIFWAPARWRYHYQLGHFLLEHYELDPSHHLPRGLKELAAAAALFPEKAEIHLRLGLALGWTKLLYPGYIPTDLQAQTQAHLDKAAALDPNLKKILKPQEGRPSR